LYFVDINAHKIHVYEAETKEHYFIEAPEMVGTVALTDDQNIILAALHRCAEVPCLIDWSS
jgi:sugar lactone lactonase YvrE